MPQWRNWQTRNVQVVVWVSMYRFESCLGHKISPVDVILLGFFVFSGVLLLRDKKEGLANHSRSASPFYAIHYIS